MILTCQRTCLNSTLLVPKCISKFNERKLSFHNTIDEGLVHLTLQHLYLDLVAPVFRVLLRSRQPVYTLSDIWGTGQLATFCL